MDGTMLIRVITGILAVIVLVIIVQRRKKRMAR